MKGPVHVLVQVACPTRCLHGTLTSLRPSLRRCFRAIDYGRVKRRTRPFTFASKFLLYLSARRILSEKREKSREKRRGVSSGPTWLPLAASLALGLFSPFLFFFVDQEFLFWNIWNVSEQRLVFRERQLLLAERGIQKAIYIAIRYEIYFVSRALGQNCE